jgi:hypothetical protein
LKVFDECTAGSSEDLVTLGRIVDAATFVLEAASSRLVLGIRVQAFIIGGQALRVVNQSGGITNKVIVVHPIYEGHPDSQQVRD